MHTHQLKAFSICLSVAITEEYKNQIILSNAIVTSTPWVVGTCRLQQQKGQLKATTTAKGRTLLDKALVKFNEEAEQTDVLGYRKLNRRHYFESWHIKDWAWHLPRKCIYVTSNLAPSDIPGNDCMDSHDYGKRHLEPLKHSIIWDSRSKEDNQR